MACATLKRSLEWDPLNTPSSNGSSAATRPTKRRCLTHHIYNNSNYPPKQLSQFDGLLPKITAGIYFTQNLSLFLSLINRFFFR